jgi:uncharacterized protein (DUF433 family)
MSKATRDELHRLVDQLPDESLAILERDPLRMGGEWCFRGTRVPARTLFDYLAEGESLESFLVDFPTVGREQAEGLLDLARRTLGLVAPVSSG